MSDDLLIVCTYTPNTPYEEEAEAMRASATRFGYNAEIVPVQDQGDWWRNCGVKPSYILDALTRHDGPLLWLDADCLVLAPLDDLMTQFRGYDIALKYRPGHCFSALFNTGVILLQKNPAVVEMVRDWAECSPPVAHVHRFPDQATFTEVMVRHQRRLRCLPLAERFHAMPLGDERRVPPGTVVFHNKISRRIRSTALPSAPPPVYEGAPPTAEFMSIGPQAGPVSGLPMVGPAAANREFAEFAARYGISKVWHIGLAVKENQWDAVDACKLGVLRGLFQRLPPGAQVVVGDQDLVFLGDPRAFSEPLAEADLVLAWDKHVAGSVPSLQAIGMRLSPLLLQYVLPQAENLWRQRSADKAHTYTPAAALGDVLRQTSDAVRVHTLPAATIAPLAEATGRTVAVSFRGQLRSLQGTAQPTATPTSAVIGPHFHLPSSVSSPGNAR